MDLLLRFSHGLYWLALGGWFGAMVMLAVSAAITFRTIREYQPVLRTPPYDHPVLADRAGATLAGAVVGNVLRGLAVIQVICAAVVVVTVILQCTLFADRLSGGVAGVGNLLRMLLLLAPIAALALHLLVVNPKVWEHRRVMYDPSRPAEVREAAKVTFDRYHRLSERSAGLATFALAAAVMVSAWVLHGPVASSPVRPQ